MSTNPMPDDRFRAEARAYLDGELSAADRREFEALVAASPSRREALAGLVRTLTLLDEALADGRPSVRDRVLSTLPTSDRTTSRRSTSPLKTSATIASVPSPSEVSKPERIMSKLQACAKCGAQFDVAAMAVGQRFTCGACGAVVTAGAAPAGAIGAAGAPSRPVPAPSRPVPAMGKAPGARSPQYVPPERATAPAARGGGRSSHEEDERASRRERAPRGAPGRGGAKRGLSPAAMAGLGGGFLAIVVGLLVVTRKGDDKQPPAPVGATVGGTASPGKPGPTASPTPYGGAGTNAGSTAGMDAGRSDGPRSGDTLATVGAEWSALGHPSSAQYREFMKRFQAVTGGTEKAKSIAAELLKQADPNDKDAHALLGHKEFAFDVPEEISFKKYPFVRAVEDARTQRWFDDDEAYGLAMKAYEKTLAHARRLADDRVYSALDIARREIDRDEHFKQYNYDAIFASPYLICYSSNERFDEEALIKLSKSERAKKLAELEKKREAYQKILAEKAKIYPQLYAEFLKRYGEDCDLHPLMDEFGGRPDYPAGKQSFREGCPLIVWIFSDKKAFTEYHETVKKDPIASGVAGYFSPATGWVYLYDEDGGDREFEVNKNVHEGTHQLEHWFTRQKNEWGRARVPQSFFGEGFAEYMGSVTMEKDRTLKFVGINRPRLQSLKQIKENLSKANKKMFVFPLKELTQFEGYHNVQNWGAQTWGVDPNFVLGLFYIQSWAFVYFLNEHDGHKYQPAFKKYLEDMLNYPRGAEGYGFEKFKREFNINTDDDWKKLQKEFDGFYDKLIKMDDDKVGPRPPARDDWPGYVPVGGEATDPEKKK